MVATLTLLAIDLGKNQLTLQQKRLSSNSIMKDSATSFPSASGAKSTQLVNTTTITSSNTPDEISNVRYCVCKQCGDTHIRIKRPFLYLLRASLLELLVRSGPALALALAIIPLIYFADRFCDLWIFLSCSYCACCLGSGNV